MAELPSNCQPHHHAAQRHHEHEFVATYTIKDAILYALSIGYGSEEKAYAPDLRYVYEHDPAFKIVPTFCLALYFSAHPPSDRPPSPSSLPPFPPPLMKHMGILPKHLLRQDISLDSFPVLHTWQKVTWSRELQVPQDSAARITTRLRSKFLSVVPKSIGAFVTSSTELLQGGDTVCTVTSTFLIMGLEPQLVIPFGDNNSNNNSNNKLSVAEPLSSPSVRKHSPRSAALPIPDAHRFTVTTATSRVPSYEAIVPIHWNTTLLYRLGSGDTNRIHVELAPQEEDSENGDSKPLVHGLCTLGNVVRIVLRQEQERNHKLSSSANSMSVGSSSVFLRSLEAKFVKPVYLGDVMRVQIWNDLDDCSVSTATSTSSSMTRFFVVRLEQSGELVVDQGVAVLDLQKKDQLQQSRL